MKIKVEKYQHADKVLPKEGQYIIGHQTEDEIVVYQAYKASIAEYSVKYQVLGGSEFSYNRMSWVKPNFLLNAALSSFDARYYPDQQAWKNELDTKEVRLQWDPDHDPQGQKMTRRAIQLGLKGSI